MSIDDDSGRYEHIGPEQDPTFREWIFRVRDLPEYFEVRDLQALLDKLDEEGYKQAQAPAQERLTHGKTSVYFRTTDHQFAYLSFGSRTFSHRVLVRDCTSRSAEDTARLAKLKRDSVAQRISTIAPKAQELLDSISVEQEEDTEGENGGAGQEQAPKNIIDSMRRWLRNPFGRRDSGQQ